MDYQSSGVNIAAGNQAVELIKESVKRTYDAHVLTSLGGFSAMYEVPSGYRNPVLVSCTDGVGTKVKLAIETGFLDTIGIDLVAMCVNDLICCGAKPLFFLDYVACHTLVPEQMKVIIDGMVEGCKQAECALVGGEMAEMNDVYRPKEYDLAGFSVGIVEKDTMIDGRNIKPGDRIYGFSSSGIHSNGFSLVRRVMTPENCEKWGIDRGALLTPTQIYVKDILSLIQKETITGIAHITGGGLCENVVRILPSNIHAHIRKDRIKIPSIFQKIQEIGHVSEEEMFHVFNMGIGMIVIASKALPETDRFYQIGQIESGPREVWLE